MSDNQAMPESGGEVSAFGVNHSLIDSVLREAVNHATEEGVTPVMQMFLGRVRDLAAHAEDMAKQWTTQAERAQTQHALIHELATSAGIKIDRNATAIQIVDSIRGVLHMKATEAAKLLVQPSAPVQPEANGAAPAALQPAASDKDMAMLRDMYTQLTEQYDGLLDSVEIYMQVELQRESIERARRESRAVIEKALVEKSARDKGRALAARQSSPGQPHADA